MLKMIKENPIKLAALIPLETSRDEMLAANLEAYSHELAQIESLAIQTWIASFRGLTASYRQVDEACQLALQAQLEGDFNFSTLLEQLEQIIPQYTRLAADLPDASSTYAPQVILDAWSQSFQSAVDSPSKRFTVTIPKRHLQKQAEDLNVLSIWKTFQRGRLSLWEHYVGTGNWLRRLAKRKELGKPRFKRKVHYKAYLNAQVYQPVLENLEALWMEVMSELAEMIIILHDDTHIRLIDLMLVEQQDQVIRKKELNQLIKHLESLKEHQVRFDEITDRTNILEAHISTQFQAAQNQVLNNIKQNWFIVGTTIFPNLLHHPPRLNSQNRRFQERSLKHQTIWQRYFEGEKEDRLKDLELALLQTQIPLKLLEGLSAIRDQVTQQILPAFANPHKVISDALQSFRASESETEANLKRDILSQNRSLLRDLRRDLLPRILESIIQARLVDRLRNLNSQIKYLVDQLPESHTIFRGPRLSKGRPQTHFITIEMKALVMGEIIPEIQESFEDFFQVIGSQSDKLSRDVTEIDQIIEFNLGAALELLSNEDLANAQAGAFSVVTEGLERARKQLALLIEESQNIHMLCRDTLPRISQNADRRLIELANNEKVVELQIRITRAKIRDQFLGYRHQLVRTIKSIWPKLLGFGQSLFQSLRAWYRRIRKITGLAKIPTDIDRQLNQYLTETKNQINALPFVYQRLFRFEPAADERFFIGREREFQVIQERFNEFKTGRNVSIALIGESGSGRTSLLNMAEPKIFSQMAKYRLRLDSTIQSTVELFLRLQEGLNQPELQSIEDLVKFLLERPTKVVVIVEDIQNMFLRVPGGFEAIKRFLLLINETSQNVFWVISCGLYSWSYFERVINIRGFFQEIIPLQEMNDESIENVIMKRHRVSGYQLEFEIPQNNERTRRWRRSMTDMEQQDILRSNFFAQLNRLAAGNLTVAILFWLKAVREIRADRFIIAHSIEFDPTCVESDQFGSIDLNK
ncbi:MAG: ATP-binding protein, partial [Candidatus Marinimicrobia bacterium]|nr:ATP-binding protein [Candidatus Neomarinimicrobiota bacterium]